MSRGRPPGGEFSNKSSVITTRVTSDLRYQLERAAVMSGRSMSQEIEKRLSDTFLLDMRLEDTFESSKNFWFMKLLSHSIESIQKMHPTRGDWRDDPEQYQSVMRVVTDVFAAFGPGDMDCTSKHKKVVDAFFDKLNTFSIMGDLLETKENVQLGDKPSKDEYTKSEFRSRFYNELKRAYNDANRDLDDRDKWRERGELAKELDKKLGGTGSFD